jgi:hypothetical protein
VKGHPALWSASPAPTTICRSPLTRLALIATAASERDAQISTDGGDFPRWLANGRQLSYVVGDATSEARRMMVVDVTPGPSFQWGAPRQLMTIRAGRPPDRQLARARHFPDFQDLRQDPRFVAILRQLDEPWPASW